MTDLGRRVFERLLGFLLLFTQRAVMETARGPGDEAASAFTLSLAEQS
jgi:hypothetical protein